MAKREHKPAKSGKQVYATRKAVGTSVICAKLHTRSQVTLHVALIPGAAE